jgi:hypothetical protein
VLAAVLGVNLELNRLPEGWVVLAFLSQRELAARELAARELAARELAARELAARELALGEKRAAALRMEPVLPVLGVFLAA